jgi:hypothetical protein
LLALFLDLLKFLGSLSRLFNEPVHPLLVLHQQGHSVVDDLESSLYCLPVLLRLKE